MGRIPGAKKQCNDRIHAPEPEDDYLDKNVLFSFDIVDKNEYFNLDGTCQNWAADLFETMKTVSNITSKRVYSGEFSREGSPLRIHTHENAVAPCDVPQNIELESMWQIRISASKGGVHGILIKNVFHVVWFDPHHNMYPNDRYGGLKKIVPPDTCCNDRERIISTLQEQLEEAKADIKFLQEYAETVEQSKEESLP